MRALGLINARGGSKGIAGKNIKLLDGVPLISYSVMAGLAASSIARVIVSTDDEKIAAVAREYGAEVPFMRPADLATDKSLQIDAIIHAIQTLEEGGDFFDIVVILQPTCPLRTAEDIEGALKLMHDTDADTVISVMQVTGQHPLTMYTEDAQGMLRPILPADPAGVLRQEFPKVLWRNGAIYAAKRSIIMQTRSLYGSRIAGYEMPEERSANIDGPVDWLMAETLLKYQKEQAAL